MRFGVDVSEHQAGFEFTACPLDFAIIRTTDGTYQDHAFSDLFIDAHSADLNVHLPLPAQPFRGNQRG